MSRTKTARQRSILAQLDHRHSLRVSELAEHLGVSPETIRRDLDELTEAGAVGRTYGGAVRRRATEPSLNERHAHLIPEREAIARAAVPVLKGSTHVMIGSGATTVHVARRLAVDLSELTVITHAFGVATVLALNPTIPVMITPGLYHATEGALTGASTLGFLDRYRADWAVIGASGLTPEGPSDALLEPAEVFAAMTRRANQVMLVADSSKFDQSFPACWASWSDVACLVTDRAPEGRLADALAEAGVRTITAPATKLAV